jgi:hypothetical protein
MTDLIGPDESQSEILTYNEGEKERIMNELQAEQEMEGQPFKKSERWLNCEAALTVLAELTDEIQDSIVECANDGDYDALRKLIRNRRTIGFVQGYIENALEWIVELEGNME